MKRSYMISKLAEFFESNQPGHPTYTEFFNNFLLVLESNGMMPPAVLKDITYFVNKTPIKHKQLVTQWESEND